MDESKLIGYINEIKQYGNPEKAKRFERLVKEFYNDPRIRKMPEKNQEALFDKLYTKYSQGMTKPVSALEEASGRGSSYQDREGTPLDAGEFQGSQETSDRALGALEGSIKERLGSTLASAGIASMSTGLPFTDVLKASLNPSTLVSMGIGTIGDMMTSGMGFGVNQGIMEKIGSAGFSMALGMANPVLGLAASTLGKPLADLVSDAVGWRDLDKLRDKLEDMAGEIGGRQIYADTYNQLEGTFGQGLKGFKEEYKDLESFGAVADIMEAKLMEQVEKGVVGYSQLSKEMAAIENLRLMQDRAETEGLYKDISGPEEKMRRKLKHKQDLTSSKILGLESVDELNSLRSIKDKYGLKTITGAQIRQAYEDERRAGTLPETTKAYTEGKKIAGIDSALDSFFGEVERGITARKEREAAKERQFKKYKDRGGKGDRKDWDKYGSPNYTPGNERSSRYRRSNEGGGNGFGGSAGAGKSGWGGSSSGSGGHGRFT